MPTLCAFRLPRPTLLFRRVFRRSPQYFLSKNLTEQQQITCCIDLHTGITTACKKTIEITLQQNTNITLAQISGNTGFDVCFNHILSIGYKPITKHSPYIVLARSRFAHITCKTRFYIIPETTSIYCFSKFLSTSSLEAFAAGIT